MMMMVVVVVMTRCPARLPTPSRRSSALGILLPYISHTHGPNSDRQPRFHKFLHLLCPYLLALPCYLYPPCSGPIQSLALPTRELVLDP